MNLKSLSCLASKRTMGCYTVYSGVRIRNLPSVVILVLFHWSSICHGSPRPNWARREAVRTLLKLRV
jgi:hypothetical protein